MFLKNKKIKKTQNLSNLEPQQLAKKEKPPNSKRKRRYLQLIYNLDTTKYSRY